MLHLGARRGPRGALQSSRNSAALMERCGRYGLLRSLWGAAVAVERLRSTLSAAVHAERCGPRCGLRSTLRAAVHVGGSGRRFGMWREAEVVPVAQLVQELSSSKC